MGIFTARPGRPAAAESGSQRAGGCFFGIAEAARSWLALHPDNSRLVIILDQFEELLAIASSPVRQDFLKQLSDLLDSDLPLTLMLVMRDDFFSRFAKEAPPELFEWVQRGFVHISASLEESDLAEIIETLQERSDCSLRRDW